MCNADSFPMPGQPKHLFFVVLLRSGVSLVRAPRTRPCSCESKSITLTLQGAWVSCDQVHHPDLAGSFALI